MDTEYLFSILSAPTVSSPIRRNNSAASNTPPSKRHASSSSSSPATAALNTGGLPAGNFSLSLSVFCFTSFCFISLVSSFASIFLVSSLLTFFFPNRIFWSWNADERSTRSRKRGTIDSEKWEKKGEARRDERMEKKEEKREEKKERSSKRKKENRNPSDLFPFFFLFF